MKKFILTGLLVGVLLLGGKYYREQRVPVYSDLPNVEMLASSALNKKEVATPPPPKAKEILNIKPARVRQGDPVLFTVDNISATTTVESMSFNNKPLKTFLINGKTNALIGIDLRMKTGIYPVTLTLSDGRIVKKNINVTLRTVTKEELGIPESFGGNTAAGQTNVTTSLVSESALVATVPTASLKLWNGDFRYPIDGTIFITDPYGDTRVTVGTSISHKGTDFRAPVGTPVYAMTSGTVGLVRELKTYGNTIVVDHGLGVQTLYMHLSEFNVKEGQHVEKGELLGKSGQTGYVLGPHLHLSIKIGGISIDPMIFMKLL